MLVREEGGNFGLDVDDADDLVLDDERDGKLRSNVGVGADVVLVLGDIFNKDGGAVEGGLAYHPLATLDAATLDLRGVTGLEAHAELVVAVIDEEDGEDAVVDDGANEVGDAMHEGVEIEGGVEGVGEAVEKVDLERLDANFRGFGGGVGSGRVVALEEIVGRGLVGTGGGGSRFVGDWHGKIQGYSIRGCEEEINAMEHIGLRAVKLHEVRCKAGVG